jgi:hypothetical protein
MFAAYLIHRGASLEEAVARAATVTRDDQRAFLAGLVYQPSAISHQPSERPGGSDG